MTLPSLLSHWLLRDFYRRQPNVESQTSNSMDICWHHTLEEYLDWFTTKLRLGPHPSIITGVKLGSVSGLISSGGKCGLSDELTKLCESDAKLELKPWTQVAHWNTDINGFHGRITCICKSLVWAYGWKPVKGSITGTRKGAVCVVFVSHHLHYTLKDETHRLYLFSMPLR